MSGVGEFWAGMADNALSAVINNVSNWYWQRHQEGREDTAIQRRVADMKAAGLNPILAAGNPAQANSMQSSNIDLGIGSSLERAMLLKTQRQEYEAQKQELEERKRNINWYKNHDMPSDKQADWAMNLAQVISMLKGNTGEALKNMAMGAVDTIKNNQPSKDFQTMQKKLEEKTGGKRNPTWQEAWDATIGFADEQRIKFLNWLQGK